MTNIIIKSKDVLADSLSFTALKKHPTIDGFLSALIKYDSKNLLVQFPTIELLSHGFPKLDKFHTQEQRTYIKLPVDPECLSMYAPLCAIDAKLKSKAFKKKCLVTNLMTMNIHHWLNIPTMDAHMLKCVWPCHIPTSPF